MNKSALMPEEVQVGSVTSFPAQGSWLTVLSDEFNLSRAELRFAEAFYRTASTKEAAALLGIAYGTARQHSQNIGRKTGAAGQVHLMKGLCGLRMAGTWSV